jgi:hypothetical protein
MTEALRYRAPFYVEPVRYTAAGIAESATRNLIDDRIFDPEQRADAIAEYIEAHHDDFFFLKSDDFASEHEFRAVLMEDGDEYAYVDYDDALVAVIVGERFSNWQLLGAKRACERANAMFGKIGWSSGRPIAFPSVVDEQDQADTGSASDVS